MRISYEYARMGVIANGVVLLAAQLLPDLLHVWVEKGLIITGAAMLSLAARCPVTDELSDVRRKNRLVGWAVAFLLIAVVKTILRIPIDQ
ncbi:MAG: hypothetical protein NTU83_04640 [Candidatus Hydrogenedentes bacterium]|nr:hypothetical protein [Candidatus Hydrogenedentota bacterium]